MFDLRQQLIDDYAQYEKSFIAIRDARIREHVHANLDAGLLWPAARIGLNPSFAEGGWIDELVEQGVLHDECARIFRIKDTPETVLGLRLRLHRHQVEAIHAARTGKNYVLTTATGSGKSLSYIVPIVDHVLRSGAGRGHIQAIVVYPMNALANRQEHEIQKFLHDRYPEGHSPVTFARYTGQESDDKRRSIVANPPDILLTNCVMLELILARTDVRQLVTAARDLRFLVFDELHNYRGRQGADVALLARRVREACEATRLQCVGTSATMATGGTFTEQLRRVAEVASLLFGSTVEPDHVIGETLRRATPPLEGEAEAVRAALRDRLASADTEPSSDHATFIQDPLSRWIEGTLGMEPEAETGRLIRVSPMPIRGANGAATKLASVRAADRRWQLGGVVSARARQAGRAGRSG